MNNGVFYGNGNILGYDRVGKDLVINPEQAETVRMIYDMYLAGDGLMKIKDELERRGRLTSMGKSRWHCTVISHVLQNTFYCGIITYHKEYVENYLDQKKTKNYGEIELTQVQGTHTPIVSVDEYERVQKIMASKRGEMKNLNSGRKPKGKTPPKTVWGKLLVCECGHKFNRVKWSGSGENTKYAYQLSNSERATKTPLCKSAQLYTVDIAIFCKNTRNTVPLISSDKSKINLYIKQHYDIISINLFNKRRYAKCQPDFGTRTMNAIGCVRFRWATAASEQCFTVIRTKKQ